MNFDCGSESETDLYVCVREGWGERGEKRQRLIQQLTNGATYTSGESGNSARVALFFPTVLKLYQKLKKMKMTTLKNVNCSLNE